jgi:histone deacetylase-like protein
MPVLLTHPDCARHAPPQGHPERPERLAAALAGLGGLPLTREDLAEATDEDLSVLHPQAYLDALARRAPSQGQVALDPDTWLSPGSLRAARLGAGGALRAVDLVMGGEAQKAFVASRPPGHHALASTPMGFCLFGNVALAARRAIDRHGAERVAIVDFDVHHGNGTQALVEEDPRILFVSTHQSPLLARHRRGPRRRPPRHRPEPAPPRRDRRRRLPQAPDRSHPSAPGGPPPRPPPDLGGLRRPRGRSPGRPRAHGRGLRLDHLPALRGRGTSRERACGIRPRRRL